MRLSLRLCSTCQSSFLFVVVVHFNTQNSALMMVNTRGTILLSFATVGLASTSQQHHPHDCYVSPSCTATEFNDPVSGFTNDTGFAAPGSSDCCEVC